MMKSTIITSLLCLSSFVFAENLLTKECTSFECEGIPKNTLVMWGDRDHVQVTSEDSYTGSKSLKVNFTNKALRIYVYTEEREFKKGETYTVSAFVRTEKGNLPIGLFCCSFDNKIADMKTHSFNGRTVTPDWKQIQITATMKQDAKRLGVLFLGKAGETMFIDEVKVEPGKKASWSDPQKKK